MEGGSGRLWPLRTGKPAKGERDLSGENKKIYKKRRPLKIALKVLGILLAALVLLSVIVFFGFQKYIVYTPEGVRLEIPFLQKYGPQQTQTPEITQVP